MVFGIFHAIFLFKYCLILSTSPQTNNLQVALKFFFFLIPLTLQMLLPCYISTELTVASEKLSMTLFHTEWTIESERLKKSMKIFMENAKNPMKIFVLKIFELNLENFVKIINSAYSLFAVLRKLDTNSNGN
jgi:hypothetical protein